jgi:hypothetical protein
MAPRRITLNIAAAAAKTAEERSWDDWRYWVKFAWDNGHGNLVAKYAPKPAASWVQVQAATAALRSALDKAMLAEKGKVQA